MSKPTARLTKSGLKISHHKIYLAKIRKLKNLSLKELPPTPLSETVIKNSAHQYFLNFVVETLP
ncbi:MAG: hypothetical protein MK289_07310 [Trichodesmium sp. ALOHA_ZT_67]|nr:hypothetical protein [Trichodesmium sp. ALOHA_ZT_67]